VGELAGWAGHSPEKLRAMQDGIEASRRQGGAQIED
jgi:rifampin ADP-ribosylating transferase